MRNPETAWIRPLYQVFNYIQLGSYIELSSWVIHLSQLFSDSTLILSSLVKRQEKSHILKEVNL
jgi:hypothetical protein